MMQLAPRTMGTSSRSHGLHGALAYLAVLFGGGVLAVVARSMGTRPLVLSLVFFFVLLASWLCAPRHALAATVALAVMSDIAGTPWYPFTKGFSSSESIMFVHSAVVVSPLEVTLVFACCALVLRWLVLGEWPFRRGPLDLPLLVFFAFLSMAFLRGASSAMSRQVATFQFRPFVALVAIYVLTRALCRTSRDYRLVLWWVLGAVFVHSWFALWHIFGLSATERDDVETLMDHGAAVRMNVLLIATIAAWTLRRISLGTRLTLTAMCVPVVWVYLLAQRRAAVVALIIGIAMLCVYLFWRQRRTFYKVVPAGGMAVAAYVAAFWNSESTAGFPAQAVKSVIAPDQVSQRNASSDLYRIIENYDINYTIRLNRVFGIGFGRPFYRPVPLPDLEGFAFNPFIPHNSFLWVWVAAGFFGFAALVYLAGRVVVHGGQNLRAQPPGRDALVMLSLVSFFVMFIVFTYVDIAWEAGSLSLLGVAIAAAADGPPELAAAPAPVDRVVSRQPVPLRMS